MGFDIARHREGLRDFCHRRKVRRLAVFGSVLRGQDGQESDIDLLVEFEPGTNVGMMALADMEMELESLLGRRVDLNTPGFLSHHFRQEVLAEAKDIYVAA